LIVVAIILHDAGGGNALGAVAAHAGSSYFGIAGSARLFSRQLTEQVDKAKGSRSCDGLAS
jgi:hypothetical protein